MIDAEADFYRAPQRERPPWDPHAGRGGDRGLRRCSRHRSRGSWARRRPTRSCSRGGSPSRSTWSPRAGARKFLGEGDEILLTEMEHHSNIVPWQMTADVDRRDAAVHPAHRRRVARPVGARVAAHRTHQDRSASPACRTRWARSRRCASSTDAAHAVGAVIVVDARPAGAPPADRRAGPRCRSAGRSRGHKMLGPTASGGLYGKAEILDAMDPHVRAAAR